MVARNLLETIRSGEPNVDNATKVLEAMAQLAEDPGAVSVYTKLSSPVTCCGSSWLILCIFYETSHCDSSIRVCK